MRHTIVCGVLALVSVMGCASTTTVVPGPTPDRIYLTKTDTFILFTHGTVKACSIAGLTVSACQDVKSE
jgi:hypothetical protein